MNETTTFCKDSRRPQLVDLQTRMSDVAGTVEGVCDRLFRSANDLVSHLDRALSSETEDDFDDNLDFFHATSFSLEKAISNTLHEAAQAARYMGEDTYVERVCLRRALSELRSIMKETISFG